MGLFELLLVVMELSPELESYPGAGSSRMDRDYLAHNIIVLLPIDLINYKPSVTLNNLLLTSSPFFTV